MSNPIAREPGFRVPREASQGRSLAKVSTRGVAPTRVSFRVESSRSHTARNGPLLRGPILSCKSLNQKGLDRAKAPAHNSSHEQSRLCPRLHGRSNLGPATRCPASGGLPGHPRGPAWEPQAPAASFVSRWKSGRFGLASGLVCPPAAPANPTSRPLLKFTTGPAQLFQARFEPLPVCPVASLQVGQEVLLGRLWP